MYITHKEPIDISSKGITQRAYTNISKNGTRVEMRYVKICTKMIFQSFLCWN